LALDDREFRLSAGGSIIFFSLPVMGLVTSTMVTAALADFFFSLHNKAFEHLKECHRHLHLLSQERQHAGADEAPKQQQQTIIIEYKGQKHIHEDDNCKAYTYKTQVVDQQVKQVVSHRFKQLAKPINQRININT
jgi:hypothetical protein